MFGVSDPCSALLTSADCKSILRCCMRIEVASGGRGVCGDKDKATYDVIIKAQWKNLKKLCGVFVSPQFDGDAWQA